MRRELVRNSAIVLLLLGAAACVESATKRAERRSARERAAAPVRASPTVQRVTTPGDSGRLLYDAPTNLADTTTRAAKPPSSP